ncbi:MAG: hypothetical protein DRO14_02345 [Thermoprotei archaeon]|nr:MAG: hypothetical protein DRO14_02345 [Thermoprotei archaeon]
MMFKLMTLIATIPNSLSNVTYDEIIRKIWLITSYLKDEVGLKVNLVVAQGGKEPQLIVMDEVIDLNDNIDFIIEKITSKLTYDVGDQDFINKVAVALKSKFG